MHSMFAEENLRTELQNHLTNLVDQKSSTGIKRFADRFELHQPYLRQVVRGNRAITISVALALGYQRVILYENLRDGDEPLRAENYLLKLLYMKTKGSGPRATKEFCSAHEHIMPAKVYAIFKGKSPITPAVASALGYKRVYRFLKRG